MNTDIQLKIKETSNSNIEAGVDASQPKTFINPLTLKVWICFFVMILIRLYLVGGQKLYAVTGNRWDDRLYVYLAKQILEGNWLGDFNNLTFVKGSFYSIWVAFSFLTGISLLTAEHLLWSSACIIFVIALRPLIVNNYYLIFTFAFLLFNPAGFAVQTMTTVMRDGIYTQQTLIILACTIAIFLRRNLVIKKNMPWSVLLGIALSSFWLTREEGIWIIPLLLIILGFQLLLIIYNNKKSVSAILKNALILVMPFLILGLSVLVISTINYLNYKTFITVETKTKNFLKAYGALTRIKHKEWKPDVPLPKEARMRIYEESPSFSELKPHLEGKVGQFWLQVSEFHVSYFNFPASHSNYHEIRAGAFMWALRDAVAAAGYYKYGPMADKYYERLAKEINSACDNGELECIAGERATMTPVWHNEYLKPLINDFLKSSLFVIKCDGIWEKPLSDGPSRDVKGLALFADISREDFSFPDYKKFYPVQSFYDGIKINVLKKISKLYSYMMPSLSLIAVVFLFLYLILFRKDASYIDFVIITLGLISILMARLFLISFINVSSFPAIKIRYLVPLHPVIASLVIICLYNAKRIFNFTK